MHCPIFTKVQEFPNQCNIQNEILWLYVKVRYCENLKKLPTIFLKLLSNVGVFFQIFVAFSKYLTLVSSTIDKSWSYCFFLCKKIYFYESIEGIFKLLVKQFWFSSKHFLLEFYQIYIPDFLEYTFQYGPVIKLPYGIEVIPWLEKSWIAKSETT